MVFGRGRDQQKPDHRAIEAKVDEEMHGLVTQLTNEITFHMRERGITGLTSRPGWVYRRGGSARSSAAART